MDNAWRRLKALNTDTEVWWDSSPLVWPHFTGTFPATVPEADRAWLRDELASMFFDAPVSGWVFDGCTTNPPLSWAVLKTCRAEWDPIIREKRRAYKGRSKYGLFLSVYREVVRRGAEKFLPLFEASEGRHGHISAQIDPQLMRNEAAMIEMGEELGALGHNVMVKVPGSTEGMPVFRHLASKGIATNATTVFTVSQILTVGKMVAEGRAIHLRESLKPRRGWRAVCTQMSGRLEDSAALRGVINKKNLDISPLTLRAASEAVIKKCARIYKERDYPIKMLHCSARRHHDQDGRMFYPHIDMFAGGDIVYTVPPGVIGDYLVHYRDREITPAWKREVPAATLAALSRIEYFRRSYDEDGYAVEEFNEIPSLLENEVDFVGAAREMIEYVGSFL